MRKNPVLDALFPRTRQSLLATLLLRMERRWYLSDLAHLLNVSPSSLQRELASLTDAGILQREPDGNRVYYRANPACSLLPELRGIFVKTMGAVEQIADVLAPFEEHIMYAFVFGSYARQEQTTASDVDLMLIGDVSLTALSLPLRRVEEKIGSEVNVTLYALPEFREKVHDGNHFVATVMRGSKIFLKGTEHELTIAVDKSQTTASHHEQTGTRRPTGSCRA